MINIQYPSSIISIRALSSSSDNNYSSIIIRYVFCRRRPVTTPTHPSSFDTCVVVCRQIRVVFRCSDVTWGYEWGGCAWTFEDSQPCQATLLQNDPTHWSTTCGVSAGRRDARVWVGGLCMNSRGFAVLPSNVTLEQPRSSVMDTCVLKWHIGALWTGLLFPGRVWGWLRSAPYFLFIDYGPVRVCKLHASLRW